MIVGVYGVGYLIVVWDLMCYWLIVLVGLLGKLLGLIGFVFFVMKGDLLFVFGVVLIINDLVWWVLFVLMFYGVLICLMDLLKLVL